MQKVQITDVLELRRTAAIAPWPRLEQLRKTLDGAPQEARRLPWAMRFYQHIESIFGLTDL